MPPLPEFAQREDDHESIGGRGLGQWRSAAARFVVDVARRAALIVIRILRLSLANAALTLTLVVGVAIAALLTNAAGEVYEAVVEAEGLARLDEPVLDAMVGLRSPALDEWMARFTDLGGPVGMPLLAALAVLTVALWWRRWTPIVLMLAGAAGSLLITVTGKELTARSRPPMELAVPPLESSASFPSGHALNATVVVGLVAYLLLIRLASTRGQIVVGAVGGVFVLTMGISRVYLGHHWLSDVIAAWLIGLGWLAVVITAHRIMITLGRVEPLREQS
ncbi:MAG: phosphatase PAP2 family protein [Dermatophilaceae bacterium]|nr:phosphatase PAP2 family protein [Intrasporangiaceae bacterium]